MRYFPSILLILSLLVSCKDRPVISNLTEPVGYAMGESVKLAFSVTGMETGPESLAVRIFEKKTGYLYEAYASPVDSANRGRYECRWDGRKPDGSWPAGGRYWVYALLPESNVVSDTVEIGLSD